MEEQGGTSSSSSSSRKRPLALGGAETSSAADSSSSNSKRPRPTTTAPPGTLDDGGGEDDLDFLLRLQAQEEQGGGESGSGGRRGAQVRAVVRRLKHTRDDDDSEGDDEEAEEEEDRRGKGRGGHEAQEQEERPRDIFTAVEFLDFEATQRLLAADPELVSFRHPMDLSLPLAVAIASRFDRGVKLLLSQAEPPCPLLLVDGRGYSALHLAVEAYPDMPFLARFLLQFRGVDVNTPAPLAGGATPLHVAAQSPEDDRALRLLLASGADVSLPDAEGRTALALVGRWPAGSKAKKRARHLLKQRAPYQSYALHKLRLLAWGMRGDEGEGEDEEQDGAAAEGHTAAARAATRAAVAALSRTAMQHLLDMRVEAQTQEVGVAAEPEGMGGDGDGDDAVLCRLETAGVYSFINATGHLCLARIDRAVSPFLLSPPPALQQAPASASTSAPAPAAAAASGTAASSATTSPSSSPITTTSGTSSNHSSSTEAAAAAAAVGPGAVSPPLSPTCCPLARLKAARAAIFDLGEADAETVLSRQNSSGGGGGQEEQGDREPWVLLPPLPTVEIHRKEQEQERGGDVGEGEGEQSLPAAVLHFVVHGLRDEGVFDALQAMLWR